MKQTRSAQTDTTPAGDRPLEPLDRTMLIGCRPELVWLRTQPPYVVRAITTFTLIESNPPMPPGTVHPTLGTINITDLPDNGFSDNIDITLRLDQSKLAGPDGTPITGRNDSRWAHSNEGPAYVIESPRTGNLGYCWFCEIIDQPTGLYNVSPPIHVDSMEISRPGRRHILIDDRTGVGSAPTAFAVAFVLTGYGDLWIPIDPLLSSKGTSSEPPARTAT